jgi:hypothetical protein
LKNDGQRLWITHYLKLNGNFDLVRITVIEKDLAPTIQIQFFLPQFSGSILDVTSSGYIERDQQKKE